jgi:hemolysin III
LHRLPDSGRVTSSVSPLMVSLSSAVASRRSPAFSPTRGSADRESARQQGRTFNTISNHCADPVRAEIGHWEGSGIAIHWYRGHITATSTSPETATPRPRLRGRVHQFALVAALVGLAWLIHDAHGARAVTAAWVYGLAMVLLYLASSSYHLYARSPRTRQVMQRVDHAMIFVLIAGTYTPVCLLALSGAWRWVLLGIVWGGAITGIVLKAVALDRFPKLGFTLYLILGWAAIAALPALAARPDLLALAALGGILYTVGAVLFALRRPRPIAAWFGYHEVWHLFGVAAGVAFFILNRGLIAGG